MAQFRIELTEPIVTPYVTNTHICVSADKYGNGMMTACLHYERYDNGFWSTMITGDRNERMYFNLLPMSRKNQKKIDKFLQTCEQHADTIRDLFVAADRERLGALLMSFTLTL